MCHAGIYADEQEPNRSQTNDWVDARVEFRLVVISARPAHLPFLERQAAV